MASWIFTSLQLEPLPIGGHNDSLKTRLFGMNYRLAKDNFFGPSRKRIRLDDPNNQQSHQLWAANNLLTTK